MIPQWIPLCTRKLSYKASPLFHECFSVPSTQKPMVAEQPWALDLMSFGLARKSVSRSAVQRFNYGGGGPGGRVSPPPVKWESCVLTSVPVDVTRRPVAPVF